VSDDRWVEGRRTDGAIERPMGSGCLWEVVYQWACDEEGGSLPDSGFFASFCSQVT